MGSQRGECLPFTERPLLLSAAACAGSLGSLGALPITWAGVSRLPLGRDCTGSRTTRRSRHFQYTSLNRVACLDPRSL